MSATLRRNCEFGNRYPFSFPYCLHTQSARENGARPPILLVTYCVLPTKANLDASPAGFFYSAGASYTPLLLANEFPSHQLPCFSDLG